MALSLNVPVATGSLGKEIETNPRKAQFWAESLTMTKTFDTSQKMIYVITTLNRARISCDERVALIEVYRPIVNVLLDELQDIYAYCLLPMPAKEREARDLAQTLLTECC